MIRLVYFLVIAKLLLSAGLNAQADLNKVFNLPGHITTGISALHIENDTIVTFGSVLETPGIFGVQFSKYDTLGNMLLYRTYFEADSQPYVLGSATGFINTSDGGYLATGGIGVGDKAVVFKFSHDGEIEWETTFDDEMLFVIYPKGIVECSNGYLISGWQQDNSYNTQGFVCKIDQYGNIQWRKMYGTNQHDEVLGFIKKRHHNSFFLSGGQAAHQTGIGEPGYWVRSWIFEIDSSGTIHWEWKSEITEYLGGASIELADTSSIVFISSKISTISPFLTELLMQKIDLDDGSTVWQKSQTGIEMTYQVGWKDLEARPQGDGWDVVGGFQYYPNPFVIGGLSAHVSFEGELVWMRRDSGFVDTTIYINENYLNSMGHLSSGSIVAGGYVLKKYPEWHNEAWLLKISPDGCISPLNCAVVSAQEPKPATGTGFGHWQVYPNPASDYTLLFPDASIRGREYKLQVFNSEGKQVLNYKNGFQPKEPIRLDLNHLPVGLYLYHVWVDDIERGNGKILVSR